MKRLFLSILIVAMTAFIGGALFAQEVVYYQTFSGTVDLPSAHGDWRVIGGRLYQSDVENKLAKINVPAAQSGEMQYEFDVRYEDGGFDNLMGGFGIHIFVDRPHHGRSWGNGSSYLLWLNYDENPTYGSAGFQAQVYRSVSHSRMSLVAEFDLNAFAGYLSTDYIDVAVKARIKVNANTGEVWVEDPTLPGWGYQFNLGTALPDAGWVSFRTNSLSVSFDNIRVTQLR